MITTYQQALDYFSQQDKVSKHYNLDAIQKICEYFLNPQDSYKIIHVAGTNGKGSTSNMCFSVLKQWWKKTGIFTSPHLTDIKERFKTHQWCITEEEFIDLAYRIQSAGIELSFFEKCCILAFLHFQQQWCEYAIIEVGLWWLLDSTNIVTPSITTITSIGYDHMNILWYTLEEISFQKSGIIKPGIPVVLNINNEVINQQAHEKWSSIIYTDELVPTNLHGRHQQQNAALAYEITRYLWVPYDTILQWLQQVQHPWRLEFLYPNILIDGAHNESWLQVLKSYLETIKDQYTDIVYCFSIKKWKEEWIRSLIIDRFGHTASYCVMDVEHILLAHTDEIEKQLTDISYQITSPHDIIQWAQNNSTTLYVVFWSLYMIGSLYNKSI